MKRWVGWVVGVILGDLHDTVWVAWGCYRGCPDCTIARGSGWVALSILRDKQSLGARECGLTDLLRAAVPDGLSLPHLHLNIFLYDFILIYLNSRVIHVYQCTNPVDLPWRTGAGPASVRCYKWGFLPRSWQGPKILYWNTLHVIYMYICICEYMYIYMCACICIYVFMQIISMTLVIIL